MEPNPPLPSPAPFGVGRPTPSKPLTAGLPAVPPPTTQRLVSLDAYRGLVMLLLASGGFGIAKVAKTLADSGQSAPGDLWHCLAFHVAHSPWNSQLGLLGCSFWDLIQPSFMFIVGVAMVYSLAKRKARGDSTANTATHAFLRALVLVLMGVFLSSAWSSQTNWVFNNVLAQIGLGYFFVYLLCNRKLWVQLAALALILVGYWALFEYYPLPQAGPQLASADAGALPASAPEFPRWEKNQNVAAHFDRWFLNLFPRENPFQDNPGGYQTLNFVPSIATMLLGVLAGHLLCWPRNSLLKFLLLVLFGAACMGLAVAVSPQGLGLCPIVKRIWSPAWVLFAGGWTIWMLAAFYFLFDVIKLRPLALLLTVIGMNSLLVYFIGQLMKPWIAKMLTIHFGMPVLFYTGQPIFSGPYGPMVQAISVLLVIWLVCVWLYRQKVFLRI